MLRSDVLRVARCLQGCLLILALGAGRAGSAQRIALPAGVFYYQPAASVSGCPAAWVNPAGLGAPRRPEGQVMADYYRGDYGKSWGLAVRSEALGVAYRYLDYPAVSAYKEYVLAGGFPVGRLLIGGSYQYIPDGPESFHKKHFWNIGFKGPTAANFNWGILYSNLNRSRVGSERSEIEQRYSLCYRFDRAPLLISVDMFLSMGTRLKNADYIYHAEYSLTPGVYLSAGIDSDRNYQFALRVNLLNYFGGLQSSFARGGSERGTTAYLGVTNARQPSVIRRPPERGRSRSGG